MAIFKKVINFLLSRYCFFLLLVVLVSYGQILWMQPWQDDNALMFKLAHIEEPAGFLGKGLLGEGPYKYTAVPYYLIYKIFGFNTIAFFGAALFFFFLATIAIFILFKTLISKTAGMLASLLFAVNFPTADSFTRLFNSIPTSVSIVLLTSLLLSYWFFYKTKKIIFFLLAVFSYWAVVEISYVRSHYLISIILIFDLLFLTLALSFKKIVGFLLRSSFFILIFFWLYILNGDARTGEAYKNLLSIILGNMQNTFSLFSGIGYLVLPDRLVSLMTHPNLKIITNPYYQVLSINLIFLLVFNLLVFVISQKHNHRKILVWFSFITSLSWFFLSRAIYIRLKVPPAYELLVIEFVGGLTLLGVVNLCLRLKKEKYRLGLFLGSWLFLNALFYILYDPTVFYSAYNNRYLVHSYIALIGILALVGSFKKKWVITLILLWGSLNLILNITSQHEILISRSNSIKMFYSDLNRSIGRLPKGAILYFDIQEEPTVKTRFSDAITASQMPETTAIAWRYGLDRYDLKLVTRYGDLQKLLITDKTPVEKIYSFRYSKNGLIDTSNKLRDYLFQNNPPIDMSNNLPKSVLFIQQKKDNFVISAEKPIVSIVPFMLNLKMVANPILSSHLKYPFNFNGSTKLDDISQNYELRTMALDYKKSKKNLLENAEISVSSFWQDRVATNLDDGNKDTIWQADRVAWPSKGADITIDLKQPQPINRLVWVNGYASNTPTKYKIETSLDGQVWQQKAFISRSQKLNPDDLQVISFDSTQVRFIKMVILETISQDAPAISEIWPVPSTFSKLDIQQTETFLENPFNFVSDRLSFDQTLEGLEYKGDIQIFWHDHEIYDDWKTNQRLKLLLLYDGQEHDYQIVIPAGGISIDQIQLANPDLPGKITVTKAWVSYPKYESVQNE